MSIQHSSLIQEINSIGEQVRRLNSELFRVDTMGSILSGLHVESIQRVILTGCAEAHSAQGAMLPAFKKYSGIRYCNAPDISDFLYFYNENRVYMQHPSANVLLIILDLGDNSHYCDEAEKKASELGIQFLRIPCSKLVGSTEGILRYHACLTVVAAIGAYIGLCQHKLTEDEFHGIGTAIQEYVLAFLVDIQKIDQQMEKAAQEMQNLKKFEVIADDNEGYSGQYIENLLMTQCGVYCDHINSEEFSHISLYLRNPEEIGMIVLISGNDPSMSRMKDTIYGCIAQQRHVVIVTDADEVLPTTWNAIRKAELFGTVLFDAEKNPDILPELKQPTTCRIAKAPEKWMFPLVDCIPGYLLVQHYSDITGAKEKQYAQKNA